MAEITITTKEIDRAIDVALANHPVILILEKQRQYIEQLERQVAAYAARLGVQP